MRAIPSSSHARYWPAPDWRPTQSCSIPGTVVADAVRETSTDIRLGHPSGLLRVASTTENDTNGNPVVKGACIERTARLIMDGAVFVRRRVGNVVEEIGGQKAFQ